MTTRTVPVLDLVAQPVTGLLARVAGHDDHPDHPPLWRRLKAVELRREPHMGQEVEWVYWTWEREPSAGPRDCGYSGMTVAAARAMNRCLDVVA